MSAIFDRATAVNRIERLQAGADFGDGTLIQPSWGTLGLGAAIATGGNDTQPFRFPTGEICVPNGAASRWSANSGQNWLDTLAGFAAVGPMNGGQKSAICFGNEVLSMAAGASAGHLTIAACKRALDYWATPPSSETVGIGAGNYVDLTNDAGGTTPGPIFHHWMLHLLSGGTIGPAYGTTAAETELSSCLPMSYNHRKYRMDLFKSAIGDKGANWDFLAELFNAALGVLGRDPTQTVTANPAQCRWLAQEGASEGCLTQRKSGDIWAFCRTGGTQSGSLYQFQWPLYTTPLMMRILNSNGVPLSYADDPRYYLPIMLPTSPAFKARWGNNPCAATLANGATVLVAGGPGGGWFMVAQPSVRVPEFESFYKFSTSDSYAAILPIAYNKALIFGFQSGLLKCWTLQVDISGESADVKHGMEAAPYHVLSGQRSRLLWYSQNAVAPLLFGGEFENGGAGTAITANSSVPTSALTATTTYRIEDASMAPVSLTVTVH